MPIDNFEYKFKEKIEKTNRENVIFIIASVLIFIFLINEYYYNPSVTDRSNISSFFSLIVQILSSVFAIIITVSLVAIQLTAQNYSSKLIKIYTNSFHFKFLIFLYIIAIIFNIYVLLDIEKVKGIWIYFSILLSTLAIVELVPFIFEINRNLDPKTIINHLVKDLKGYKIPEKYVDLEPYDPFFQPIEDIITRSISNFDYQTAKFGIRIFMQNFLNKITSEDFKNQMNNKEIIIEHLKPYFVLLWNVSNNAKKSDAIEIIKYIFNVIFDVINELPDNNYLPIFDNLVEIIENVRYQSEKRFDNDEYILELTEMKLMVADSLSEFSEKTI